ncbi:MAG TPA: hypothetical protein VIY68_17100 [Steroidobacteraceae bacterium]
MTPKPQVWKIARILAGVAITAGVIYFLHRVNSTTLRNGLILVVMLFFARFIRSLDTKDLTGPSQAVASSNRPWRDFGLAVACFVATMAVTLGIAACVDHNVLPDNKVTEGILWAVIIAGIAGAMWFMSGIITRVVYGPPPPPET